MQSTLSQLYYGNLYPFLTYKPALEETVRLFKAAGGRYDRFRKRLPEEMREPFDALLEDKSTMLLSEMEESFIDGFRIGARLMLEVFYNVSGAPGTEDEE